MPPGGFCRASGYVRIQMAQRLAYADMFAGDRLGGIAQVVAIVAFARLACEFPRRPGNEAQSPAAPRWRRKSPGTQNTAKGRER